MRPEKFKLTIVTPFYNEQADGLIDAYFQEVTKELSEITDNWEIITIDDGSSDNTFKVLESYHAKDGRIKVIKLSRNFGKEAALTAGLNHTSGDAVIPMDADLQHPAFLFKTMVTHWQSGYDVVIPIRKARNDVWLKRITGTFFYWLFSKIIHKDFIIKHAGDFRLLDKKIVLAIRELKEYNRFMKVLFNWPGFQKKIITYTQPKRLHGTTKFNYIKLLTHAIDGIFSFSVVPIRFITSVGFLISISAFSYGVFLAYRQIFQQLTVPGYTSIMVAILLLGGLQILALGVIGEYIGRIYSEAKHRPIYVIDEFLS